MKIMLFFLSLLIVASTGFADNFVFDNQTSYPVQNQKSKIAIQWASSAKEVAEANEAFINGNGLNAGTVQAITRPGKSNITIPKKSEYFRVLVWSNGQGDPDYLTNWVDVVPNKTYTIKSDDLVPSVLMTGMGC